MRYELTWKQCEWTRDELHAKNVGRTYKRNEPEKEKKKLRKGKEKNS